MTFSAGSHKILISDKSYSVHGHLPCLYFCEVVHERERNTRLIFYTHKSSEPQRYWIEGHSGHAKSSMIHMELLIDAFECFES